MSDTRPRRRWLLLSCVLFAFLVPREASLAECGTNQGALPKAISVPSDLRIYTIIAGGSAYSGSTEAKRLAQEDVIRGVRQGGLMWASVLPRLHLRWATGQSGRWADTAAAANLTVTFRTGACGGANACYYPSTGNIEYNDYGRLIYQYEFFDFVSREQTLDSYEPATLPPVAFLNSPNNPGFISGRWLYEPPVGIAGTGEHKKVQELGEVTVLMYHEMAHALGMRHWFPTVPQWTEWYGNPNSTGQPPLVTVDASQHPELANLLANPATANPPLFPFDSRWGIQANQYYGGGQPTTPWQSAMAHDSDINNCHWFGYPGEKPRGIPTAPYHLYNNRVVFPDDLMHPTVSIQPMTWNTVLSYPYTHLNIAMQNSLGDLYETHSWYDAIDRMFDTPAGTNRRYFVLGLDPVRVSTVAGTGAAGDTDGAAEAAAFRNPGGMAVDGRDGTMYVCDYANHKIKRIRRDGSVTTFAGTGVRGLADGPAASAMFDYPGQLALAPDGSALFVVEYEGNRVRRVGLDGQVRTVAGSLVGLSGYQDATGTNALFNGPSSIAVRADGMIFVADTRNHRIRQVNPADGAVTTFAGDGQQRHLDGPALQASFDQPVGLAIDRSGNLYVGENHRLRRISSAGTVTTIAGDGQPGLVDGPAASARFGDLLSDLTVDGAGRVYVADHANAAVRLVVPEGSGYRVSTVAGDKDPARLYRDGPGAWARFHQPTDVESDNRGNVFVSDYLGHRIRKMSSTVRLTLGGNPVGGRIALERGENWFELPVEAADRTITLRLWTADLDTMFVELYGPDNPFTRHTTFSLTNARTTCSNGCTSNYTLGPGRYYVRVTADPAQPNDTGAFTIGATSSNGDLVLGSNTQGNIAFPGDNDWYRLTVTQPGEYAVRTFNLGTPPVSGCRIYLYSQRGLTQELPIRLVAEASSTGSAPTASLSVSNMTAGRYWIRIRAADVLDTGRYGVRASLEVPLLVTLESFSAELARPRGVLVRWTTASEIDTAGFRVVRERVGDTQHRTLDVFTSEWIPSKGGELQGADYDYLDEDPGLPGTVRYYLEDIDSSGRVTRHGPVEVDLTNRRRVRERPGRGGR